jgi:hypothetical protein
VTQTPLANCLSAEFPARTNLQEARRGASGRAVGGPRCCSSEAFQWTAASHTEAGLQPVAVPG